MIVTKNTLNQVIAELSTEGLLAFDTETTGLRPYHSDRAFCATIASDSKEYFFNFTPEYAADSLAPSVLLPLINNPGIRWVMCNAKFDMAMMAREGMFFSGPVCELQAAFRLLYNEAPDMSLEHIAKCCGFTKSEEVEKYIAAHGLYTKVDLPHVKRKRTDKHFDRVPVAVLAPYALQDARVTYDSFVKINERLNEMSKNTSELRPSVHASFYQELEMTKVLFHMEHYGVLIDRQYCNDSAKYYTEKLDRLQRQFKETTGKDFAKAPTLFKEIFAGEEFEYTEKNNVKFDKRAFAKFKNPVAKIVIEHSAAKKQIEYFNGFIYHADQNDVIHTQYNQAGTTTGRLSSSSPNLQNLTKPDKYEALEIEAEPTIREALVAREGFFFAMLDYEQIEYRVMLDMAKAHGLIEQVVAGLDVHEATAKIAGVTRQQAKTTNFLTLYGGGIKKLAGDLNCSEIKAREIQSSIFKAAPEIKDFIRNVIRTAETRGYVFNLKGRRYHFSDVRDAYKAPNHLIQGTCSEILKEAMIKCERRLAPTKSRLVLSIHDELIFEIAFGDEAVIPELKYIMESSYKHKYLPLAVDIEIGLNLADKRPFSELASLYGKEERNSVQGASGDQTSFPSELLALQDTTGI